MSLLLTPYSYLAILLTSLACLALADRRWRLVVFDAPSSAFKTWLTLMGFFLAWDLAGIALGIFATNQRFVSGLHLLTPNLPIEEFLFLSLLIYVTLLLYRLIVRGGKRV